MSFLELIKKNTQFRSSLLTMTLALVSALSILLAMFQVTAWFKNFQTASTDAVLTNFETKVEYSIGNNSWKSLSANTAIPVVISGNTVKLDITRVDGVSVTPSMLQLRITYKGKSNAFVRLSAYGSFQNADTHTYLPQLENLWILKGTNWQLSNGYVYYKKIVGCTHDETVSVGSFAQSCTLESLTVTLDATKLSAAISPHQDYQGELYIHVDAVQPDRFQEYWEITQLPFALT